MPACILRYVGTNSLAGFYAFETENALFDLRDQEVDPSDYEYAIIREGFGIEFRNGGHTVDLTIGEEKDPRSVLSKAETVYMTEGLLLALLGDDDLSWHRLCEK